MASAAPSIRNPHQELMQSPDYGAVGDACVKAAANVWQARQVRDYTQLGHLENKFDDCLHDFVNLVNQIAGPEADTDELADFFIAAKTHLLFTKTADNEDFAPSFNMELKERFGDLCFSKWVQCFNRTFFPSTSLYIYDILLRDKLPQLYVRTDSIQKIHALILVHLSQQNLQKVKDEIVRLSTPETLQDAIQIKREEILPEMQSLQALIAEKRAELEDWQGERIDLEGPLVQLQAEVTELKGESPLEDYVMEVHNSPNHPNRAKIELYLVKVALYGQYMLQIANSQAALTQFEQEYNALAHSLDKCADEARGQLAFRKNNLTSLFLFNDFERPWLAKDLCNFAIRQGVPLRSVQ